MVFLPIWQTTAVSPPAFPFEPTEAAAQPAREQASKAARNGFISRLQESAEKGVSDSCTRDHITPLPVHRKSAPLSLRDLPVADDVEGRRRRRQRRPSQYAIGQLL